MHAGSFEVKLDGQLSLKQVCGASPYSAMFPTALRYKNEVMKDFDSHACRN